MVEQATALKLEDDKQGKNKSYFFTIKLVLVV